VNTVTGFYRPNAGRFEIDGLPLNGRPPYAIAREGLARTFQNTELFGDLSVIENVMVGYQRRLAYNAFDAAVRTPRFRAQRSDAARPRSAFWRLSISRTMRKKKRAFCRSACSAGSKSRAPSPPRRACCFWMSRPRV
jgi:ABC-type branched-subunit amino acid transport system ATPase component